MTPEGPHVYPIRVYYEDTDAAGIVYYANYLKFAERARTELMRTLGFEHRRLMEGDGIQFAVRRCEADYRKPARLDDLVEVHSSILAVRGASFEAAQVIRRGGDDLVRLRLKLACLNRAGRPARLPGRLAAAFRPFTSPVKGLEGADDG